MNKFKSFLKLIFSTTLGFSLFFAIVFLCVVLFLFQYIKMSEYNRAIDCYDKKDYICAFNTMNAIYNSDTGYKDIQKYYPLIAYEYYLNQGDNYNSKKQISDALNSYKLAQTYNNTTEIQDKIKVVQDEIAKQEKIKKEKIEAEKRAKEIKIKALKNKMRFIKDNVTNITFIQDKTSSQYANSNSFYVYIAQGEDFKKLWLRISYTGEQWVFFEKMIVNIDGQVNEYAFNYYDLKRSAEGYGVYEYIDLDYELYKNLIQKIINSKKTIIRLAGNQRHFDKTISETEKQAMRNVLEYYNY